MYPSPNKTSTKTQYVHSVHVPSKKRYQRRQSRSRTENLETRTPGVVQPNKHHRNLLQGGSSFLESAIQGLKHPLDLLNHLLPSKSHGGVVTLNAIQLQQFAHDCL